MHLVRFLMISSGLAVTSVGQSLENEKKVEADNVQSPVVKPNVKYYVHVVPDGEDCDNPNDMISMCANKNFVCRTKPGEEPFAKPPSCYPYDPTNMEDNPFVIEETAVVPWGACNPMAEFRRKIGDPPVCKRGFQCLCLHGAGGNGICAPADAVDDANGAATCGNKTTCTEDKYCHYLQAGGIECGPKPYYL